MRTPAINDDPRNPGYTPEVYPEDFENALELDGMFEKGRASVEIDEYGLYNNAGFRRVAPGVISDVRKEGQPVGVMIADLDSLKAINDDIGHYAGDQVIDKAKEILAYMIAEGKILMAGRIGGDEFGAICKGDAEQIRQTSEEFEQRYREYVEEDNGAYRESGLDVSVGSASLSEKITTFSAAMREADKSMYEKKFAKLGKLSLEQEIGLMESKRILDASEIRLRDAPKLWRQRGVL